MLLFHSILRLLCIIYVILKYLSIVMYRHILIIRFLAFKIFKT